MPLDEPLDAIVNTLHFAASHACPLVHADGVHLWAMNDAELADCRVDDGSEVGATGISWFVDTNGAPERNAYAIMTRVRGADGAPTDRHLVVIVVDETLHMRTMDRDGLDRVDIDPATAEPIATGCLFDAGCGGLLIAHLREIGRWKLPMPFTTAR